MLTLLSECVELDAAVQIGKERIGKTELADTGKKKTVPERQVEDYYTLR